MRPIALVSLVVAAGIAGCGGVGGGGSSQKKGCEPFRSGEHAASLVVVLFDRSKSTGSYEIKQEYASGFDQILEYLGAGQGGLLAVAPIDESSLSHFTPLECSFPKKSFNTSPLVFTAQVRTRQKEARERAASLINGRRRSGGTTILDAVTAAGRILAKNRETKNRYLVLFSDMIEESDRFQMTDANLQPDAIRRFIRRARTGPYFPDLSGVDVYVVGAGTIAAGTQSSLKGEQIERFWLEYFSATGAMLDRVNYGSSLPAFP